MRHAKPQVRPSIHSMLVEQREALESLEAEVGLGIGSQRHYDDCEERAHKIGRAIPRAFREGKR
tara:strand:+ start:7257 stop:7448 length:192 start_codon:yes stop_codon:yes gene_type:complete